MNSDSPSYPGNGLADIVNDVDTMPVRNQRVSAGPDDQVLAGQGDRDKREKVGPEMNTVIFEDQFPSARQERAMWRV